MTHRSAQIKKGCVVVEAASGEHSLHFRMCGNKGPTILLVHGVGTDSHIWAGQQEALSKNYTTLAVDLRGWGRSVPPHDSNFSYAMYAQDLKLVLSQLKIESVIYWGVGMGASLGLYMAAHHRPLIKQLIVSDPNLRYVDVERSDADDDDWSHELYTQSDLKDMHSSIKSSYADWVEKWIRNEILPDRLANLGPLRRSLHNLTLTTSPDVCLKIMGYKNPDSFMYHSLVDSLDRLIEDPVDVLIITGTSINEQQRAATADVLNRLSTIKPFIYQFPDRGTYTCATDIARCATVVVNFINWNRSSKEVDGPHRGPRGTPIGGPIAGDVLEL